ncbi:hypothetical protein F5Y10DRAFT_289028 [Nemania abortiva]|nr:hypothetical protein F5Y10DRAFT_289028 [Nemania abortiva]
MSQPSKPSKNPNPNIHVPVRKSSLGKAILDPSKTDMDQYDEYLRNKWDVTDPMPDSFDPDKLEAVRKSRFSQNSTDKSANKPREKKVAFAAQEAGESQAAQTERHKTPRKEGPAPIPDGYGRKTSFSYPPSPPESGGRQRDKQLQPEHYQSEHPSSGEEKLPEIRTPPRSRSNSIESAHRGRPIPISTQRAATPRIGSGSRPPLSPSAFVEGGGVPCTDGRCQGACKKGIKIKGHAKPPQYFPFNKQSKSSRSRSRSRSRSKERRSSERKGGDVITSWI